MLGITHSWHHAAGADAVIEAGPALVVGVLALVQHVLVATIVGLLVGHPTTAVHFYRVTAGEVVLHLGTVTTALIVTTLEVLFLVEDNLQAVYSIGRHYHHRAITKTNYCYYYLIDDKLSVLQLFRLLINNNLTFSVI